MGKVDGWSCCQENMPVISRRKVILGLILSLIIVIQLLTNSYNASTVNHSLLHKTQHSLTKVQYNNLLSLFSTQCIMGYSLTHPITVYTSPSSHQIQEIHYKVNDRRVHIVPYLCRSARPGSDSNACTIKALTHYN